MSEQIVTTARLADGRVAVLVTWSDDTKACELQWDLTVQALHAAGYTEGLEEPVLALDAAAEVYLASPPARRDATPVEVDLLAHTAPFWPPKVATL